MSRNVEHCHHCGRALHPDELIVTYEGMLFCCDDCCLEHIKVNTNYSYDRFGLFEEGHELVRGSDIGITAPLCPLLSTTLSVDRAPYKWPIHVKCMSSCAWYRKGRCGVLDR